MQIKRLAAAVSAALMLLTESPVHAAGLGKLTVQSTLGQPLSADIEVLLADPSEFKNLHAQLGSQDAFRSANVEMTSTLEHLKFNLEKHSDGSIILHLTSDQPIRDPYLDVIVDLDWSGGEMMREYTVLLDPPGLAAAENQLPVAGKPVAGVQNQSVTAAAPATTPAPVPASAPRMPAPYQPRHRHAAPAISAAQHGAMPASGIRVKSGMTLSEIARDHLPEGVELDQMLVGLYHANPQAFDGNMNRMKAGSILKVPDQSTLTSVSETDAAREVSAQTHDWHAYREKLAGMVESGAARHTGGGAVSGKVTSGVEDKSAPPLEQSASGVLKLSKGGVGAQPATKTTVQDQHTAAANALAEARSRQQALQKNIEDEQKLLALKQQQAAAAATAAPPVAAPVVKPAAPATPLPAPAPHPHHVRHPVLKMVPPPAPPAPKWYQMINPLYAGGAALALLLGGLMVSMRRSRKGKAGLSKLENSILTSVDSKPNTVYNTQSGEAVNTNNTSFLTDFSQSGLGTLDTHDVDPIAEAEVYMAYGRDTQAEEILREAMVKEPARHEIKLKLLEIYAGRNNLPAFENIATDLFSAAGAESPVWEKAAEMGRRIDPHNPLYGGGAAEPEVHAPVAEVAPLVPEIDNLHIPDVDMHVPEPEPEHIPEPAVAGDELPDEQKLSGVMEFDLGPDDGHAGQPEQSPVTDETHPAEDTIDNESGILSWDFIATDGDADHGETTPATTTEVGESEEQHAVIAPHDEPSASEHAEEHDHVLVSEDHWQADDELGHASSVTGAEAVDEFGAELTAHPLDQDVVEAEHNGWPAALETETGAQHLPSVEEVEIHAPAPDHTEQGASAMDMPVADDLAHSMQGTHEQAADAVQDDVHGDVPLTLDFSDINLDLDAHSGEPQTDVQSGESMLSLPESTDQFGDLEQEIRTKFELAQVYQEMGDYENAREILQEVMHEGNEQQKKDAGALLAQMPG